MSAAAPATLEALVEAVAASAPAPIVVCGGGTTRPRPDGAGPARLDLRHLTGITSYDPAECVITARAGTTVQALADTVAAHGQYLPWDPPMGGAAATVGGMIAAGLSGPGRYRYGGVRDFITGARVVDGRGRLIASGGQVVKNAAGFLLHHALAGSAGRLGVIAEVSLKVFPRPEATRTLVARAPSLADALAAHDRLRRERLDLDALDLDAAGHVVSTRVAGAAGALDRRLERALRALQLPADVVAGDDEARHWRARSLAAWPLDGATVKVPVTPSRLAVTLDVLMPLGPCLVSVGGAVVYVHSHQPLAAIEAAVSGGRLQAAVVRGPAAGTRLGTAPAGAFLDRVRATLDPDGRFH